VWTASRHSTPEETGVTVIEGGEDNELGPILAAIADEVQDTAAAASAAVGAEYAAKVAHARRHLPWHQVAGAVRAFDQERKASLEHIKRNAATSLAGRQRAAIELHRGSRQAARRARRPRTRTMNSSFPTL
jgi:hypothetical protein